MTPLLRLIAGSRRRLALSFIAFLVPLFGYAIWVSHFIREHSSSPSVDLILITAWMFLALAGAFIGALLVCEFAFPAGWRETNILGISPGLPTDDDADIEAIGAATQSRTLPFAVILVLALGVVVYVSHLATGRFLVWYSKYGYATSTLRGDETSRKVAVLEDMTRAQDDRLITFTDMMIAVLDDPDSAPELRTQAIWSLGEVGRRMERSIELMAAGEAGGKWVRGLRHTLRSTVEPELLKRLKAKPPTVEAVALVYGLGAMRNEDARAVFKELVATDGTDRALVTAIVRAMATARPPRVGLAVVRPLLLTDDQELFGLAAWAVGEMYGFGSGESQEDPPDPAVVRILRRRLPRVSFETQCLLLDSAQRVRAEDLDRVLFQLFESVEPVDRRCPRRTMDRRFQPPVLISKEEEFREKVVKTLAAIAEGNDKVRLWLREKSQDENVASGLRRDMRHVLEVVNARPAAR